MGKPIYVEIAIRAPLDELWRRTQSPDLHQRWDLRFTRIDYLPRPDPGTAPAVPLRDPHRLRAGCLRRGRVGRRARPARRDPHLRASLLVRGPQVPDRRGLGLLEVRPGRRIGPVPHPLRLRAALRPARSLARRVRVPAAPRVGDCVELRPSARLARAGPRAGRRAPPGAYPRGGPDGSGGGVDLPGPGAEAPRPRAGRAGAPGGDRVPPRFRAPRARAPRARRDRPRPPGARAAGSAMAARRDPARPAGLRVAALVAAPASFLAPFNPPTLILAMAALAAIGWWASVDVVSARHCRRRPGP